MLGLFVVLFGLVKAEMDVKIVHDGLQSRQVNDVIMVGVM